MKQLIVIADETNIFNEVTGEHNRYHHGDCFNYQFNYLSAGNKLYRKFVSGNIVYSVLDEDVCEWDEYESKMRAEKEKKEDEELLAAMKLVAGRIAMFNKSINNGDNLVSLRFHGDGSWSLSSSMAQDIYCKGSINPNHDWYEHKVIPRK